MICERCGAYVDDTSLVCFKCGSLLSRRKEPSQGVDAIRQGREGRPIPDLKPPKPAHDARPVNENGGLYGDFDLNKGTPSLLPEKLKSNRSRHSRKLRSFERDAGRPQMRRGVPSVTGGISVASVRKSVKPHNPVSRHSINWAKVAVACAAAVMLMIIGGYLYLTRTLQGQIVMARYDKAQDSQAMWIVGESYFDQGYITKAIETFEKAREMDMAKDPPVDNIDGLLLLGAAYEAGDRREDAEVLYELLYKQIVPSRPEPYRNLIRMMLDREEDREAGELMLKAFENTGVLTFRQQRTDLLPKSPETNLSAGRYTDFKDVEFTSPQGYDIYYSVEPEAVLPDEGTLYTGPIRLEEGTTTFHVVCVSGRLVSDPMTTSYTVYLPSPSSPKARLAPGAYSRKQKVHLYSVDKGEELKFFYTLDGSEPTVADAPEYTGEAIQLPTGNVTLKAITVNSYGKTSFVMEINYRIDVKPYPQKVYDKTDVFASFELMKTNLETFQEQFGPGVEAEQTEVVRGFEEPCRRFDYDWGHILVGQDRVNKKWYLIRIESGTALGGLPRNIEFGMSSEEVISKFRDGTQLPGASGVRGLYYSDSGMGRYYPLGDDKAMIKYTCRHTDGNALSLELYFTGDKLNGYKHWYSYD